MSLPNPQQIGSFLEQNALNNRTVFYSDLVNHFSLPPLDGAWSSHPLSGIFSPARIIAPHSFNISTEK